MMLYWYYVPLRGPLCHFGGDRTDCLVIVDFVGVIVMVIDATRGGRCDIEI